MSFPVVKPRAIFPHSHKERLNPAEKNLFAVLVDFTTQGHQILLNFFVRCGVNSRVHDILLCVCCMINPSIKKGKDFTLSDI